MKSAIGVLRLRYCSQWLFLNARLDGRDPAAAPQPPFGALDLRHIGKLGDERGNKRYTWNWLSLGWLPGQLSSISDGNRNYEYADCRGEVFCQVMSNSLRDIDIDNSTDSTILMKIEEVFENNKEWGEHIGTKA